MIKNNRPINDTIISDHPNKSLKDLSEALNQNGSIIYRVNDFVEEENKTIYHSRQRTLNSRLINKNSEE